MVNTIDGTIDYYRMGCYMASQGVVYIDLDDTLWVSLNGTFHYASADAGFIPVGEVAVLYKAWERAGVALVTSKSGVYVTSRANQNGNDTGFSGRMALVGWVAKRRGYDPQVKSVKNTLGRYRKWLKANPPTKSGHYG